VWQEHPSLSPDYVEKQISAEIAGVDLDSLETKLAAGIVLSGEFFERDVPPETPVVGLSVLIPDTRVLRRFAPV